MIGFLAMARAGLGRLMVSAGLGFPGFPPLPSGLVFVRIDQVEFAPTTQHTVTFGEFPPHQHALE